MQTYETLFITTPTLTDDEEQAAVDALSRIVTDGGGSFVANERMGRRRLAYPIQKHNDGVYIRFLYDSDAAVPKELERRIGLSDNVLRCLTVRLDGNWAGAAKEQAVRDAEARAEAVEREKQLEKERLEAEAQAAAAGESVPTEETGAAAASEESASGAAEAAPGADEATPTDEEVKE